MEKSVVIAGFGGQGVMMIGQLLGACAHENSQAATFFPSYGPEQRGGTANCMAVISDTEVGFPVVDRCDIFVPMNRVSFSKYQGTLLPGGLMIADESLDTGGIREDINTLFIPVGELALNAGSAKAENLVVFGAVCKRLDMFCYEAVERAVTVKLGKKKELLPINLAALKAGWEYADTP